MVATTDTLWPTVRKALFATAPLNVTGALLFTPPMAFVRGVFGLPEGNPLYLWLIATWVLIFGLAYLRMALRNEPDRTFMMVGAAGKGSFAICFIGAFAAGAIPPLALGLALPDAIFAALFAMWLWRTR
ncbi:MAG: hypothetical protein JST54_32520 [Deltaproteobacteria bacterium]|nr:hypothetical protein [Deltaproteobacteria bacterium]